ncbi:hypothetical protein BDR06DRAFT_973065 [Suillus hirtellus]|nr:hypothetical protein BDR06DRAFT_973065 [Suillus hirtellus]
MDSKHGKIADAYARRAMNVPAFEQTPLYIAPLSVIARGVSEVQELRTRNGIESTHVIMTSEERDPEWWMWVDYTAEQTGNLWKMSNGAGFVGTRSSTMSTSASRRVQSWDDGTTQLIGQEWPGADADRIARIETTLGLTSLTIIFYL